jgi:hypothetical protein
MILGMANAVPCLFAVQAPQKHAQIGRCVP